MNSSKSLPVLGLTLLLIALTIQSVSAITCYVCNSKTDKDCDAHPINPAYVKDCGELKEGSKYDRCRKILQWVDAEMEGMKPDHRVIRTCGWPQGEDERECYYRAGFGGRQQVCSCQADTCNAATKIGSTTISMLGFLTTLGVCLFQVFH